MPGTLDWPLRRLRFDQGHGSRDCRSCQAGQLKFIAEDRDLLNGIPAASPAEDTALKQAETKIGEFSLQGGKNHQQFQKQAGGTAASKVLERARF